MEGLVSEVNEVRETPIWRLREREDLALLAAGNQ